MSEARDQVETFELLDTTLEAYGADAARWPMGTRAKLAAFVASNSEAQRRVAAARALDKVLGFAPKLSDARQADLAERIVARAAVQSKGVAQHAPSVVRPNFGARAAFGKARANAFAGAALAASLVLGIMAGQNATVGTLAKAVLSGSDTNVVTGQQLAQSDGTDSLLDEDLL